MKWAEPYRKLYGLKLDEVPSSVFDHIRGKLEGLKCDSPLVTVSVIAYNEETHLAACLMSLADQECPFPYEIIGVNNDSKDRTEDMFRLCGVTFYTEMNHSCGWARQCGLSHARGKYHLNIDADTVYPPDYVRIMTEALMKKGTSGVCSLWSYFPNETHSKAGLFFYETFRDIYLWLQHFKRPELAVRGLVFGYPTEMARNIGIRTDIVRGEDGSLALELKKHGKIRFLHRRKARAVTGYGTMDSGGTFFGRFVKVAGMRLRDISSLFTKKSKYEDDESNLIGSR